MSHLAVVTGSSRGIGRAMARRLASERIAVAAVSRTLRPGDGELAGSLEETVEIIRAEGGVAQAFAARTATGPRWWPGSRTHSACRWTS